MRRPCAAYVLDPGPGSIAPDSGAAAVVLCCWRPGDEDAFPGLAAAREAGVRAAALVPLLPGWTADRGRLESLAARAREGGAEAMVPILPALDGDARRSLVEARASLEPAVDDRFFETVHHGDWAERLHAMRETAKAAARLHGLATTLSRPVGRFERPGNAAAAASLEEEAERRESDEHVSALLHAAVRWIDDAGRDLAAVAREGNFRKVFPFSGVVADIAEAALRESR
jgi:hypothetical protein